MRRTVDYESEVEETAQEKKLRLAKKYLQEIDNEERARTEQEDVEHSVSQRLNKDYLDSIGKLRKKVADQYKEFSASEIRVLRHKLQKQPVTCLCLSHDDKFLFSGCKTSILIKWSMSETGEAKVAGSFDLKKLSDDKSASNKFAHPTSIAITTDFTYLALADLSNDVYILCPTTMTLKHTFTGHRDKVTGLVFRRNTHMLYSGSADRSVKIWSLDEMAYVETLFGHQFPVTSIDALARERIITSGGSDQSIRIWKVAEESQLVFHGHNGNIEQVRLINEDNFFSSSDDGSLCTWSAIKKKPLCTIEMAHGRGENGEPNWITALATLVTTDLAASGSSDGFIRLWKLGDNYRTISQILQIPVPGFINSLMFTSDGSKLIAGVGQEHRLGRWWKHKNAKNCVMIIPLKKDC